jgi:hypothetical protein
MKVANNTPTASLIINVINVCHTHLFLSFDAINIFCIQTISLFMSFEFSPVAFFLVPFSHLIRL